MPMIKTKIGKAHRVGGSLMVTLPDDFVKEHNIKSGDEVVVAFDSFLQIVPHERMIVEENGADKVV